MNKNPKEILKKIALLGAVFATSTLVSAQISLQSAQAQWGGFGQFLNTWQRNSATDDLSYTLGKVGIGTVMPRSDLSVQGGVSIGEGTYATAVAPANGLIVQGNVGIGTTQPQPQTYLQIGITGGRFLSFGNSGGTLSPYAMYIGSNAIIDQSATPRTLKKTSTYSTGGSLLVFNSNGSIQMQAYDESVDESSTLYAPQWTFGNDNNMTATGNITAAGFFYASDARLKKEIEPLEGSLEKILKLEGVRYLWKDASRSPETQIGFIAQDVRNFLPELVYSNSEGVLSVDYARMTPILVEAIKQQEMRIDQLEKIIEGLIK